VLVRAKFRVKDSFILPENQVEYKIFYDDDSKWKFKRLFRELKERGYTPWLYGSRDDATLVVRKHDDDGKPTGSRFPALFLFLTLAAVGGFGLLQVYTYQVFAPSIPSYVVIIAYSLCVGGILLAHEYGHRLAAEREGVRPPRPYFIPGIPGITAFLPSVGILSSQREPAVNMDSLFDISLSGPVVALVLAAIIYLVGEFVWVQSAVQLQNVQVINAIISVGHLNPSVLQAAIDALTSPFTRSIPAGYEKMSPLLDAGTVGFFLTFVNLLPMTQFDGGHLLSTSFGARALGITTLLSAFSLAIFDTPNYLFVGIFVLVIAGRETNVRVLDEISAPSRSRKIIFILMLAIAFLCLPVPQNIATIPI
jgi:membrane-associated protease RseP (regulator of RpoE activity)